MCNKLNKKRICNKKFVFVLIFVTMLVVLYDSKIVYAENEKIYCVEGDVRDYICGCGTYFDVERNVYRDEAGNTAYCLEADLPGPEYTGTSGYNLNASYVCNDTELVNKLRSLASRGYPSGYINYKVGDYDDDNVKQGLFINDTFYECSVFEAKAVTAFAIHKIMYDYSCLIDNVDEDCIIESFENGPAAEHDLVTICNALLECANGGMIDSFIDISWENTNEPMLGNQINGNALSSANSEYIDVYAQVAAGNCYIDSILIDSEMNDIGASIEEYTFISDSEVFVKLRMKKKELFGDKKYGIKCEGVAFSYDIKILGNDKYQDVLVAPNNTRISNKSDGKINAGRFSIHKHDYNTNSSLANVTFGVYEDETCKHLLRQVTTNDEGVALISDLPMGEYYFKELVCPKGYILDNTVYKMKIIPGGTDGCNVYNKQCEIELSIEKQDSVNGKVSLGDATFTDAEYGVYAKNTIFTDINNDEVMYEANQLVCRVLLDDKGCGKVEQLPYGDYYVKEIKAPKGYLLSEEVYDISILDSDNTSALESIGKHIIVKDEVIKGSFEIYKYYTNESGEKMPLAGAGFSACLISDLELDDAGNYCFDIDKAVALGKMDEKVLFTNEEGYLKSKYLPYGKYLVRETIVPEGYNPVDDFVVNINESSEANSDIFELEDVAKVGPQVTKAVKVEKRDGLTGDYVVGAKLEILDELNNTVDSWISDEKEHIISGLIEGKIYILHEVDAPKGYLIADDIEFMVDDRLEVVTMYDEVPVATICVLKQGVIKGENIFESIQVASDSDVMVKDTIEGPLEGVKFELYAAEDIAREDFCKTVLYRKGDKISEGKTDVNGKLEFVDLPLGKYDLVEVECDGEHILESEPITIELEYADSKTRKISREVNVFNRRIRNLLSIVKVDGNTGEILPGVEFSIYAKEDIYNYRNEKLYGADDLICKAETDENGQINLENAFGPGKYYIEESKCLNGYVDNGEKYEFEIKPSEDFDLKLKVENYKKPIASSASLYSVMKDESIKTGDSMNVKLWLGVMLMSFVAFACLIKKRCRKN